MYLQKIMLQNFRCFENLSVPFHENLTVVVGTNGAGKTTILEAAAIAAGTLLSSFDGVSSAGIKKTDASNKYFKMGSVIDVQPQYPVCVSSEGVVENQSLSWSRSLNSANGKTTLIDAKEMTEISKSYETKMMHGDTSFPMPIVAYYGTGRLWDYHRAKRTDAFKNNNRANAYIDCLDGTANVKLMINWFKKMAMTEERSANASAEFTAVRHAMEQCFVLMTGYDSVEIQFNYDTGEIDVSYWNEEGNSVKIPLNQLSDGYKGTISLIADIAYRMAVLNPFLSDRVLTETTGVILIDEIDLHLHPAWQQRIIGDLTRIFPKVQFIVSTHAPAVINSVKSENLIILKDQAVLHLQNQVYGKDVKSVLNEVMGVAERPIEIAQMFTKFYEYLACKDFDAAEQKLNEIDVKRDYHDPEIASCRVKLKLERIRGGQV